MTFNAVSDVLEKHHEYITELFDRVSSPTEDRPEILKEILREISADVAAERSIVLPALGSMASQSPPPTPSSSTSPAAPLVADDTAAELEADYKEIERLLILIERRKVNSPDIPELVTELKDASEQHIARMSALLPALDEALLDEDAEELAEQFETQEQSLATHPHPHLLSVKPLSKIATRLAAHYDRARDRTVDNRHGK